MNRDRALKPYSSLPEPFVLMAALAWISLVAASWAHTNNNDGKYAWKIVVYGLLLAGAAAHTWFFALRALWSNASHLVSITALWLVGLAAAVTWIEWGTGNAPFGLLAFVLIALCSFLFNHATLRLAHVVTFAVMLVASMKLPLGVGGAAWLAFALVSMFVLAYDRTALKAGPTGYDNGEPRRTPQRLAVVSTIAIVSALLFFVTPLLRWPDLPGGKRPAGERARSTQSPDDPFGISGSTRAPNLSNADLEVMQVRIEPSVAGPLYLRGQAFDTFDGKAWSNSRQANRVVPLRGSDWTDLELPGPMAQPESSTLLRQTVEMKVHMEEVLFTAARPQMVQFPGGGRTKVFVGSSDRSLRVLGTLPAGSQYRLDTYQDVFSDTSLLNVSYSTSPEVGGADLAVPSDVDPRVLEIARRETAGHATPYQKALALERYLRRSYFYSLTHDVGGSQVVNDFMLRAGRGHCALFASSMVVMARGVGLPARYVTGFLANDPRRGVFTVRGSDAHAWVEVYVYGAGWIAFDPTSGRVEPGDVRTGEQARRTNDARVDEPSERGGGLYGRDGEDFGEEGEPGGDEIARNEPPQEDPNGTPVPGDEDPSRDGQNDGQNGAPSGQGGTNGDTTVVPPGGSTSLPRNGQDGQRGGQQRDGQRGQQGRGRQGRTDVERDTWWRDSGPPSTADQKSEPRTPDPPPPDPAQVEAEWRTLVIAIGIIGIAGLVALLVWQFGVRRVVEHREIRRALPLSVEDDPDPQRFVVKLYHAMVAGLGRVGFPKREAQTPWEYAASVGGREQTLSAPVGELTELFHLARYGDRPLTRDDAVEARSAWRRIATSVKRVSSDETEPREQ